MERLLHYIDPTQVWQYRDMMLEGIWITATLSVLTFLISIVPAFMFALGRRFGPTWLDFILACITNVCRSVPTVLTVVFIYLALPFAGITLSAYNSVLLSLTIMQVVLMSEVFRGALAAVGRGQFDAAHACGLRTPVVLRKVILPQAALVAAPAFANSLVLLVQNTSIAAAIALNDLISSALAIQNITGEPSPLVAAAIGYLILILPLVRWSRWWESRMARAI